MYFSHISIGGGIVGIETTISAFNNVCFYLKNKKLQKKYKGKKFTFAIVDTKPENIPGGVAYGFKNSKYGYFNNPLRLSPDNLKEWILLKKNKRKLKNYIKMHGGYTGKTWLKQNSKILNSNKSKNLMELYFPRALGNIWMEDKLLALIKQMETASKKFSIFFEINFIKGNVTSIKKESGNFSKIYFKNNKYEVLNFNINNKKLKKINFTRNNISKSGSIYSITQSISIGLPPPAELASKKASINKNYIRDFYYSGATANLLDKINLINKSKRKKIIIYFIGYKAGLLEPLSELKNIIKKNKISIQIICSSSNLMGIQKAIGSINKKKYKLNLLNENKLNKILTAKNLYSTLLKEFNFAEICGYKKYDAWTEILNKEILNKCIKKFSNKEKNIYKNFIFDKIRSITRFTYPSTIEARDELISNGILQPKKETVKRVDLYKNKLLINVKDSFNNNKKYLCDIVVNVSGPLSMNKLKNESPLIKLIEKNKGKIFGKNGGFIVNNNFKITSKSNIYLPGYIAHGFNPSRKTIIKAILENSNIAGKDIAKKLFLI